MRRAAHYALRGVAAAKVHRTRKLTMLAIWPAALPALGSGKKYTSTCAMPASGECGEVGEEQW